MLILPACLALAAAAMKRFPFHGRLLLDLTPAFYLMIAEGTDLIRVKFGRRAYAFVLVLLLFYPCMSTLYEATGHAGDSSTPTATCTTTGSWSEQSPTADASEG